MEIKRKFDFLIETNRRYTIRQTSPVKQIFCNKCNEPMMNAEQVSGFFGIKQRNIFQFIETEALHYTEIEAGAVMICLASLAIVLDDDA